MFLGPKFFGRGTPKFLTEFKKLQSPPNMWQSLVTIGPETSEIRRRKKGSKRIETSAVKYNGRRPASWRAAIIMNLVSGYKRCMQIYVGVHLGGGVKWEWGCRRRQFVEIWVATSSQTSEIRPAILYATCYPLSACEWLYNEWPRMTLSGYFMSKIRPLSVSTSWLRAFDFQK